MGKMEVFMDAGFGGRDCGRIYLEPARRVEGSFFLAQTLPASSEWAEKSA